MTSATGLRDTRERLIQTLGFEAGGLLLVTPLYAWISGAGAGESLRLLAVLAVVVMAWAALFNTLFDRIEHRWTARVASDRPPALRMLHAVALEAGAVLVTWPLIVAMTGMSWGAALLADLGLTAAYMVYGYAYHRLYDRWRPVSPASPTRADGA